MVMLLSLKANNLSEDWCLVESKPANKNAVSTNSSLSL